MASNNVLAEFILLIDNEIMRCKECSLLIREVVDSTVQEFEELFYNYTIDNKHKKEIFSLYYTKLYEYANTLGYEIEHEFSVVVGYLTGRKDYIYYENLFRVWNGLEDIVRHINNNYSSVIESIVLNKNFPVKPIKNDYIKAINEGRGIEKALNNERGATKENIKNAAVYKVSKKDEELMGVFSQEIEDSKSIDISSFDDFIDLILLLIKKMSINQLEKEDTIKAAQFVKKDICYTSLNKQLTEQNIIAFILITDIFVDKALYYISKSKFNDVKWLEEILVLVKNIKLQKKYSKYCMSHLTDKSDTTIINRIRFIEDRIGVLKKEKISPNGMTKMIWTKSFDQFVNFFKPIIKENLLVIDNQVDIQTIFDQLFLHFIVEKDNKIVRKVNFNNNKQEVLFLDEINENQIELMKQFKWNGTKLDFYSNFIMSIQNRIIKNNDDLDNRKSNLKNFCVKFIVKKDKGTGFMKTSSLVSLFEKGPNKSN